MSSYNDATSVYGHEKSALGGNLGEQETSRMLKAAGINISWPEERKKIEQDITVARDNLIRVWLWTRYVPVSAYSEREWSRATATFHTRMEELNCRIVDYNLNTPVESLHLAVLDSGEEITRITEEMR